ncbi:MAG: HipA domain-containing protein [Planctomycetes bacterium]|nr:HipA domain-containing protein [Planctomycetota bacterium]
MTQRCRSTLAALPADGYTVAALRRLTGSRRRLPTRLRFTRSEVIRYRAEVADRMSISGVQDKVSLRLIGGDLVPTERNGEFILKPIPGTPLPAFTDEVPANEHLTMQIAEQVFGITTAANALVTLADGEPAYLTARFDRRAGQRLDMEDFCALTGQSPANHGRQYKYQGSYEGLATVLHRHCPAYAIEAERLFVRIVANYALGNGDAHLKNFSLFTSPDGDPVLTPAYDLVNTALHLPHETPLALDLFADDYMTPAFKTLGFHRAGDFQVLAQRMGLVPRRAQSLIERFQDPARWRTVDDLVERSFLSPQAQAAYRTVLADRRRALAG